jgi:hypothetical protein
MHEAKSCFPSTPATWPATTTNERSEGHEAEPRFEGFIIGEVLRQHLDREDPVGGGVMGTPNLTHAAAAQQLHQAVAAERRPVHISLRGNGGSANTVSRGSNLADQNETVGTPRSACHRAGCGAHRSRR